MIRCGQEHELRYLLKHEGGHYCAQVMGIPGIIIGADSIAEIKKEVPHATRLYLAHHDPTHTKVQEHRLKPSLHTTSDGAVLDIVRFSVRCRS